MKKTGHEFLPHTADIQAHIWAPSLQELFQEVGLTLMGIIVEGPEIGVEKEIEVECQAEDLQALFFDWLSEILFYFDAELFVIGQIDIQELVDAPGNCKIRSTFKGETFREGHHVPGTEVKAITYSYMELGLKEDGLYHLMIIFDI